MRKDAFIHIAIRDLLLSAELKEDPRLRGCPVIIGTGPEGVKKGDVVAVSPEAKALGLSTGMSVRKAVKAAPEVIIRPARYEACEALSDGFFAILGRSFQDVESLGLDEAFMASMLRGSVPGATSEEGYVAAKKLIAAIQGLIRSELGLHTTVGIGPNKLIARLAGLGAGDEGIRVVTRNEAAAFVKSLPIRSLPDVNRAVEKRLTDLGLATVEEISKTPLLFLKKNFDKSTGAILYDSSRAVGPEDIVCFHEPGGLSREVVFERPPTEDSIIKETLYMLTGELTARLKAEASTASGVAIKVTRGNFACMVTDLALDVETDSFNSIWAGVLELFLSTSLTEKVLLLGLKLTGLSKKACSGGPPV